jgi:hemerythrin-like metal-binding protein
VADIPWLQSFTIGHADIDRRHRQLLETLNAMNAAREACDLKAARACCHGLREQLRQHFDAEEQLLRGSNFPRLDEHLETHDAAWRVIGLASGDCLGEGGRKSQGDCQLMSEHNGCAERWTHAILRHVILADLDFKSHLQAQKLVGAA